MRRVASLPFITGLALVSVLLSAPPSVPAAPQSPDDRAQAEPAGTGRLTVTVLAADTGAPVRQALVTLFGTVVPMVPATHAPLGSATLSGAAIQGGSVIAAVSAPVANAGPPAQPGRVRKEAQTDQQGRVEFTSLPGGQYSLSVAPPSPFIRPRPARSSPLEDGGARSLTIRVERGGVITGRLLDAEGGPVTGATVYALAERGTLPARIPAGRSTGTDDRGHYRIFDLPAGPYLVLAAERPSLRRPTSTWAPHTGHVPTYYPGTADVDGGRPVTVAVGQEVGGVDFSLAEGRLGRVRARVIDSAGRPVPGDRCGAALVERTSGHGPTAVVSRPMPDGGVVFQDVPPGEYVLTAQIPRADAQPGYGEGAYLPVRIDGQDVQVDVQTNQGATLSGRILFDSPMPDSPVGAASSALAGVSVITRPASALIGGGMSPGRADVAPDGTFTLTGVRGAVMIVAATPRGVLKSITRGPDDLVGAALELKGTERIDEIEIVLTTATGILSGTVVDATGQAVPGTWLVAFGENAKYWFLGSPYVRPSQAMTPEQLQFRPAPPGPDTNLRPGALQPPERAAIPRAPGRFAFLRLLPGRYRVAAIPGVEGNGFDSALIDKDSLARLRDKATMATVVAGQATEIVVRIDK